MRSNLKGIPVLIALICLAASAFATERKIAKSDLPPVVLKTAEQQSVGATVNGYSKDLENGKLEYEVQMTSNGHSKDVTIAPDGQLIEIEEQVMLSELPANVKAALQTKAGKGKITKVESLTKHGVLVAYEADVVIAGKHSEVQVGPNGQPLNHEE
ncbi:MAG TPA: hypothetical protein VGT08_16180 [Terracidiphilus sp.]|nr:hypothetical protein [Terracidiphilus sp.]